MGLKEKEAYYI